MAQLPDAKLFIAGELRDAANGRTYDVTGPWTGEPVGKAADASAEDVEAAIVAARTAFDTTDWSTNVEKRLALVTKYRELFEQARPRLAELARHEAGAAQAAIDMAHVNMALEGWDDYLRVFPQATWRSKAGTTTCASSRK
jgi:aldehyde dehydrogenase (NAD+)